MYYLVAALSLIAARLIRTSKLPFSYFYTLYQCRRLRNNPCIHLVKSHIINNSHLQDEVLLSLFLHVNDITVQIFAVLYF